MLVLVGDVGGTYTRVELREMPNEKIIQSWRFEVSSARGLVEAMKQVETDLGERQIESASFCAPGPCDNNVCLAIANFDQESCAFSLADFPAALVPSGRSCLMNDLVGVCHAVSGLCQTNKLQDYFKLEWAGHDGLNATQLDPRHNHLIIAVGTGLGNAMLVGNGTGFSVLPLEGGHCNVHWMPEEKDFLKYYAKRIPSRSLEWDDICSGRGLSVLYEFHSQTKSAGTTSLDASGVAQRALAGTDEHATAALLHHYQLILRFSQNMIATLQARTVVLCGDNHVTNSPFFSSSSSSLHSLFLSHSSERFGWLSSVSLWSQTLPLQLQITGSLSVARSLLRK